MKRIATALLLFALLPGDASAQFIRGWGIRGGAAGAYQVFTYTAGYGSPGIPRSTRWGISTGLFIEFLNIRPVSLVLEAEYTQKGRRVTDEEIMRSASEPGYMSAGPAGLSPHIDYLSFALFAKARTGNQGFVPFFLVGPRFDFVLSKSTEVGPVFQNYKKSDIGISMGVGLDIIPRRRPVASIEARWSPSFSRAFANSILVVKNQSVDILFSLWL